MLRDRAGIATNEILINHGIMIPLEQQATTTVRTRLEKGIQAQMNIFGGEMKDFYQSGPEETQHINY